MELFEHLNGKQMGFIQHDDDAQLVLAGQLLNVLADVGVKRGKVDSPCSNPIPIESCR